MTRCFMLEDVPAARQWLRRYAPNSSCPVTNIYGRRGIHDARTFFADVKMADGEVRAVTPPPRAVSLWPQMCECGFVFRDSDEWQLFAEQLYMRVDTNELHTLTDAPPGAMWYADWMLQEGSELHRGPDDRCLAVRLPNGLDWIIDGPAANCSLPQDRLHKCWVRHGTPPDVTVDKDGRTCSAGAGSIQAGSYHGFLRNGVFT